MKTKPAFTLAEVLITLGIIEIVAALTISALIDNYQKKLTVVRLQKTFSEMANISKLAMYTGGMLLFAEEGTASERFGKYVVPYLKTSSEKVERSSLDYYTPGGSRETGLAMIRRNTTEFILLSGVSLIVYGDEPMGQHHASIRTMGILIDTNGYKNPPNKFGHDAFYMVLYSDGKVLLPMSDDGEADTVDRTREQLKNGPSGYSYQCNESGRGMWCTYPNGRLENCFRLSVVVISFSFV